MNAKIKPIILACALSSLAGPALAVTDTYLIAKEFTKTLPDGSTVTMWGYALDVGGACYNIPNPIADRRNSAECNNPVATAPGPVITLLPGDPNARIFLTNLLPVPTSIFMTGQERPFSATNGNGPTWNDGTFGARTSPAQKMRSYGREAGPNGGRRAFVWNNFRETPIQNQGGTFIYYSGTEPQKQVYMGLYGAVTQTAAAGEIYPGVPYGNEQIMFYSDIDPAHNAAIADTTPGTLAYDPGDPNYTPIDYNASWFLINGEPYASGSAAIPMGNAGAPALLRFASAASEKHVPVLQGMHGTIHAEDGIPYTWQDSAGVETLAPIEQYSVDLPPLKTKDVIVSPAVGGTYAVYDGNGYMTNPSDPEDASIGDGIGGMLAFLDFGAALPVGAADEIIITFPAGGVGSPGTVNVLANDSDPEGGTLSLVASDATTPTLGGLVECTPAGDCTFTPDAYVAGADSFTYSMSNGTDQIDGIVVSVTLVENQAPVPVDDPDVVTDDAVPVTFNVLANDTDAEGDTLSIVTLDTTGIVEGSVDCPDLTLGECTYTPPEAGMATVYPLVETFTYTLTDGVTAETTAVGTVTVTVNEPAVTLEAVADAYTLDLALSASLIEAAPGVLVNDTYTPTTLVELVGAAPASAAVFSLNSDGSFSYEPTPGFSGIDSFSYQLDDGGTPSAPVVVTIEVLAAPL
ncbi:MAG: Ig-like domain-containing protein [Candidatus Thiodiazotropha sp.]